MSLDFKSLNLKKRIGIWALGQILPRTDVLKPHLRSILFAVIAAAAAGCLLVIAIVAVFAAIYFKMLARGIDEGTCLMIIGAFTILLALIIYLYAKQKINNVTDLSDSTSLLSERPPLLEVKIPDEIGNIINDAINGFLEGFLKDDDKSNKQ